MIRPLLALAAGSALCVASSGLAQTRESCVRELKPGDPVPALTLGCVPKSKEFTVYWRNDRANAAIEATFDVDRFPTGYSAQVQQQGNFSFIVDSILTQGAQQILRGSLSDGRGCPIPGKFFVYTKNWACTLYVEGQKQ
jgi:hypothetical protein